MLIGVMETMTQENEPLKRINFIYTYFHDWFINDNMPIYIVFKSTHLREYELCTVIE